MSNIAYRPDIDGLRAVAVIPVILYHAGAEWMPGGFVGVDIFFVISGYLISSIILREVGEGKFSFLNFYERRIRRIIPALLAMVLVTVALFQFIALPDHSVAAGKSAIAALFSVSNFWFWLETGYFSPSAEIMPLLHTWSLAVEEQFYLLFPPTLLILTKLRWDLRKTILVGTVLAFAVGLWLSAHKPSVAYFLLPARAWELGIGAVLATGIIPKPRGAIVREAVAFAGLTAILFSLFWIHSSMIFPGWVALIPCLGTALVIHSDGRSLVAQHLLSARPVVFVGLLSYSLYLWHWPVLVAIRVYTGDNSLPAHVSAAAIPVIFFISWLSWRYVEKPFRSRTAMPNRQMGRLVGAGSAALLAVSAVSILAMGFPARLDAPARLALSAAIDIDPLRPHCEDGRRRSDCRFGPPGIPVTYAVVGDSHAAAIRPGVEASGIMGSQAGTLYWRSGCPLLDGARLVGHPAGEGCVAFKKKIFEEIERNPNLHTIILVGRWTTQITGTNPELANYAPILLSDDQTTTSSLQENRRVFERSLARTITRLQRMGKKVVVIGSIPEPGFDVPHSVATALHRGRPTTETIERSMVVTRLFDAEALLSRTVGQFQDVRLLSIWEGFCGQSRCRVTEKGFPIYYDDDHLSYRGAIEVGGPAIRQAFSSLAHPAQNAPRSALAKTPILRDEGHLAKPVDIAPKPGSRSP